MKCHAATMHKSKVESLEPNAHDLACTTLKSENKSAHFRQDTVVYQIDAQEHLLCVTHFKLTAPQN